MHRATWAAAAALGLLGLGITGATADPTAESGPTRGADWTSPTTGMEFVWLEDLGIWMGRYEATNQEYRRFSPDHDSGDYEGHDLNGDQQPAVRIRFEDALAFAKWMQECDGLFDGGLRYRIPADEDWVEAARAGEDRRYPWGDEMPPRFGNYHDESGAEAWDRIADYDDGFPVTAPVERSGENPLGLFGVGGNVWEMTSHRANPSVFRAWRGASWSDSLPAMLRCDAMDVGGGDVRSPVGGFRLALAPMPADASAERESAWSDGDLLEYGVQESDSIASIARLFVVDPNRLREINGLHAGEEPYAGQRIVIPPY
jgi:formylglycine-generating enzyme required for sulfatase activity